MKHIPEILQRELDEKALRHSLWIALYLAQNLGRFELANRLTATLVEVDASARIENKAAA